MQQELTQMFSRDPVESVTTVVWWILSFVAINKFLNDGLPPQELAIVNALPVQILLLFSVVYKWASGANRLLISVLAVVAYVMVRLLVTYRLPAPQERPVKVVSSE